MLVSLIELDIKNFTENIIEFEAHLITNAETLWLNQKELFLHDEKEWSSDRFNQKFAYAIKDNEFFEDILFHNTAAKKFLSERYGGIGVGTNGGGARCGNDGNFQIKGIGKNPLAGQTSDHWHSYGGLNLVDAIYEAINSAVFSKILPIGVAAVYGIIITGKKTAVLPGLHDSDLEERRGYGALLVREACIRPAHFFRAPNFKPAKKDNQNLISDVARVRNVNKALFLQFSDSKAFITQIGKYLASYANQFAFARAARISHGSISPSNMCLDGRWLDLTNTSFLEGGKNTGGLVPFYAESAAVMDMLEEFIYTFSKYNGLKLNPRVLLNYYLEQLQSYFISHVSYIIGVNYTDIEGGITNPSLIVLGDICSKFISSAKQATTERAYEYQTNDPVICLIEALFISLENSQAANAKFNFCLDNYTGNSDEVFAAFSTVLVGVYKNLKNHEIKYKNFVIATAIIALKRALIPEYFFMGRLEGYIYGIVKNAKEELFATVIEDSIDIADWAFNLNECLSTSNEDISNQEYTISIFKTQKLFFWFEPKQGRYGCFDEESKNTRYFEQYGHALLHINTKNYCKVISEYCFSKYLERLGSTISILEKI